MLEEIFVIFFVAFFAVLMILAVFDTSFNGAFLFKFLFTKRLFEVNKDSFSVGFFSKPKAL